MKSESLPDVLTKEEQKKLLSVFNKRYLSSYRNRVMIKLMLDTGLRVSEISGLKWKRINLSTGKLKVVAGKGNKDRMINLPCGDITDTVKMLSDWKDRQYKDLGLQEYVFTTRIGKQLNTRDIRTMVYTYADKAGIQEEETKYYHDKEGNITGEYKEKKVGPHTLRHTYATDLLRESKNIRLVQKSLGHSDLSTTMIYTHIVDDEYEDVQRNFRN